MILHMIQLDPESRFSAESYLQNYASILFPGYFSPFLHNFYSCLNPLDSDTRVRIFNSLNLLALHFCASYYIISVAGCSLPESFP